MEVSINSLGVPNSWMVYFMSKIPSFEMDEIGPVLGKPHIQTNIAMENHHA